MCASGLSGQQWGLESRFPAPGRERGGRRRPGVRRRSCGRAGGRARALAGAAWRGTRRCGGGAARRRCGLFPGAPGSGGTERDRLAAAVAACVLGAGGLPLCPWLTGPALPSLQQAACGGKPGRPAGRWAGRRGRGLQLRGAGSERGPGPAVGSGDLFSVWKALLGSGGGRHPPALQPACRFARQRARLPASRAERPRFSPETAAPLSPRPRFLQLGFHRFC